MSWQSVDAGTEVARRDAPWDTRRFGLTVVRVEVPLAVPDEQTALGSVLSWLADDPSDLVVLRHPAAYVDWFSRLRDAGRDLIAADTLVYWRLAVGAGRRPAPDADVTGRPGRIGPRLVEELVTDMFGGYGNHYLANPLLAREAALAGYVEWGQRSATDDVAVVVARRDDGPVGLATLAIDGDVAEIQLAGIRRSAQRTGFYAHLLAACEDVAQDRGATSLVISTQAHNAHVQRAWARFGLEPVGALSTVHAVRRGLLPSGGRIV